MAVVQYRGGVINSKVEASRSGCGSDFSDTRYVLDLRGQGGVFEGQKNGRRGVEADTVVSPCMGSERDTYKTREHGCYRFQKGSLRLRNCR